MIWSALSSLGIWWMVGGLVSQSRASNEGDRLAGEGSALTSPSGCDAKASVVTNAEVWSAPRSLGIWSRVISLLHRLFRFCCSFCC